ncbi:hypothetical protein OG320_15985 [Microbispora sp. NBC_01189]|uniref:hypothetical protein n=1 Tax=Microbispora sp. NBC_01189 TaxID=2903583 RepID=UPI002E14C51F|nr:hypothetical protein OG320_15985 [Microbispora sp. NBC_01189]
MSVMREELHHLVDRLPEEKVAPLLRLVRDQLEEPPVVRDLPFIGLLRRTHAAAGAALRTVSPRGPGQ